MPWFLVKAQTNVLNDTMLTAEKEYFINFTEHQKKFCLNLHYNGVNSLHYNGANIC